MARGDAIPDTILGRFEHHVAVAGEQPALAAEGLVLSYAALDEAAGRIARMLLDTRPRAGAPIGLIFEPGPGRIAAAIAILKAGCAYVPIDPTLAPAHINDLLVHAACAAVLASPALARGLQTAAPSAAAIAVIDFATLAGPTAARSAPPGDSPAYIRYTSGSTGAPKGIAHGQATALHLAESFAQTVGLRGDDRVTLFNPFWHTLIWGTLIRGAALHLFDLRRGAIAGVAEFLDREGITIYSSFPTAFRHLTSALPPTRRLASVRTLSLSGESIGLDDIERARRHFAPDAVLVNNYGTSELGHIASFPLDLSVPFDAGSLPVGRPVSGVEILLVDEHAHACDDGERGEIAVRSAFLTSGYLGRPDLTARSFVPDPDRPGATLYLTGDIGRRDAAGDLHVVGRKDRQVKIRGHRVQPDEVEALLAAHPGIKAVAIHAYTHWSGDTQLAAHVVPAGDLPTTAVLRSFLAATLPDYMVPTIFAPIAALPLTAAGKVDWRALPPPDAMRAPAQSGETGCTTALELQLMQIWEELLATRPIGPEDDFFELGGDSLMAAQVALRAEALCGHAVPVTALFDTPTIRGLAARLGVTASGGGPTVTTINVDGTRLPLFFFHPDHDAAFYATALARHLPRDQPVHVIAPHGRTADEPVPVRFEIMGASRAAILRAIQPRGPYALAGFCNGGLIALATAQELARLEETVDMIVLIDAPSGHVLAPRLRHAIDWLDRLACRTLGTQIPVTRIVGQALHGWYRWRDLGLMTASARRGVIAYRLRSIARALGLARSTGDADVAEQRRPDQIHFGAINDAARHFLPRRQDAALTILVSSMGDHHRYLPARWHRVSARPTIRPVPGTHLSCITREGATIAAELQRCLLARRDATAAS